MPETPNSLLNVINASGFLFQLHVEQEMNFMRSNLDNNWEILAREHRWIDPESSIEGFIDLVIESAPGRMVVECKRVTEGNWVFLVPDGKTNMQRAQLFWTLHKRDAKNEADWDEFKVNPSSPESTFCVVRGQGEKDAPMLERLAGILVRSIEAIGNQDLAIGKSSQQSQPVVYFPVIVTNATLYICKLDQKTIDITTGKLPEDAEYNFEPVPVVRFRKSLSTTINMQRSIGDLRSLNANNERTVFIINASQLSTQLREWNIAPLNKTGPRSWPWEV